MKKILVPTDFSTYSDDALKVAVILAKKSGAELYLLHLERVMAPVSAHGSPDGEKLRISRNKLIGLADDLEHTGLKVHTIFVEDHGLEEIEKYQEPYGIDFIVMGSHGQSGLKDHLIGSNTRRLVRAVRIPVLVVKSLSAIDLNFKKIVFASSFRDDLKKPIAALYAFSELLHAEVHFLFLNLFYHLIREEQAMDTMESYLKLSSETKVTRSIVETNDEVTGIRAYLESDPADLIAVSMKHIGIPARWVHAPLAEQLIRLSNTPVLILPE